MSPDNLTSSSVKKSTHLKPNKEDQTISENGRIIPSNNTSTSTSQLQNHQQDQNFNQNNTCSSNLNQTQIPNPNNYSQSNSHENNHGLTQGFGGVNNGDMLLQWGQRKRSRCSRMEKHQTSNHVTPPVPHPPCRNNGVRSGSANSRIRPNGLLYAKDCAGFLPSKNRNLADQMGCSSSASPSKNGRNLSRSGVGKRSPSNDKKNSGSGSIRRVKSDDSLPQNHCDLAHSEQENGRNNNNNINNSSNNNDNNNNNYASVLRSPVVVEAEKTNGEVVEWPRIYLSLSRKEKEDDFYAMKGTKLPHRPKKRAKAVDRALQYCFPGLWLSDLTRARYEIRERKSAKKPKRRGLKGLENMESESE